jgi:transcription initiation factor TFIIB
VPKKEIGRTFKQLEKFLSGSREKNATGAMLHSLDTYENTNSTSAEALCGRYCSNLDFRHPVLMEKYSKLLAQRSSSVKDLAGRSPLSVAAACIFMTSHLMGEPKPSKDIALVAGVSDGTIKTAYRYLYQARDQLIDKEWLAPIGTGDMSRLPAN